MYKYIFALPNFSGEGAGLFEVAVLRSDLDVIANALLHGQKVDGGWSDDDL